MSKLVRLSLSLEDTLLDKLSVLVQDGGYENRSEYIRDLIRDEIARKQWSSGGEVIADLQSSPARVDGKAGGFAASLPLPCPGFDACALEP